MVKMLAGQIELELTPVEGDTVYENLDADAFEHVDSGNGKQVYLTRSHYGFQVVAMYHSGNGSWSVDFREIDLKAFGFRHGRVMRTRLWFE